MIGNKRPIDNHFDASSSYPHPKRIRKNIYPLLPQGLPAEKRSFVSRASDYLGGFFASLTQFSANATQAPPHRETRGIGPSRQQRIEPVNTAGGGQIMTAINNSRPNGVIWPTSTGMITAGDTRDAPVDLTADDELQSESSDDPIDSIPRERNQPGPSQRSVASSSHSHAQHRGRKDGSRMQIRAEKKGRTYTWESTPSFSVLGGGQSSSNPISIEEDSEPESEHHKSRRRRRPHKDPLSHKISTFESQLAKAKREKHEARSEEERRRLQQVCAGLSRMLDSARLEKAESRRAVQAITSGAGIDTRAAYERQLHQRTAEPRDAFLKKHQKIEYIPRRTVQIARHETSQDISEILEKFKISKVEETAAYLKSQKPSIPDSLPSDQAQAVKTILERPAAFKSPKCFNEVIEAGNIKRLRSGQWLSDDIMAYYAGLILKRNSEAGDGKFPSIHYFNTFFYTKLAKQGYSSLRRWTKKVDIFSKDMVLVPINIGNMHWIAAVINFKQKRIEYFDSMGSYGTAMDEVFQLLHDYVIDEHKDKKGSAYDMSGWTHVHSGDAPQQTNGSDCGIFSCQTLELVARGADPIDKGFEFSAANMEFFRQLMIHEISVGELRKRW